MALSRSALQSADEPIWYISADCRIPSISSQQQRFGFAKRESLPQACRRCAFLKLYWGECPKHRCVKTVDGEPGLNYLCLGLKQFISHIQNDLKGILRNLSRD